MSAALDRGILAISIDLEIDPTRRIADQQARLEESARVLIRQLEKYGVPATWGVADPAVSVLTERLATSRTRHEIAILGDASWVGAEAGRMRFSRELNRRAMRARAAGLDATTLLLRGAELDDHFDTAIRHGITSVRGPEPDLETGWFSRDTTGQPHALRFGLWQIPVSIVLPAQRTWFGLASAKRGLKRAIDQACSAPSLCQLKIDGLKFSEAGSRRQLEQILKHADRRRQAGLLAIATLAETADLLSASRQPTPARSILRPAA